MTTINKILKQKGHQVWSIESTAPVFNALQSMADKDIGALAVMEGEALVGIISERDYARKVLLKGKTSRNTRVSEIMTPDVITVKPQQTAQECMAIMERKRIRYLPVIESGRLVGIVSIGDILQAIISEQQVELNELEEMSGNKDL